MSGEFQPEDDVDVDVEDGTGDSGDGKPLRCCSVRVLQLVIAILIFVILIILFMWVFTSSITNSKCDTADCLLAAAEVKKNMNSSVDPCEDFYEFACGNFIATQQIPPGKQAQTTVSILRAKVTRRVKDILASNTNVTDAAVNFQLAKARFVYRQCLESELFGTSKKILGQMFNAFGPLPVLQQQQWANLGKKGFMRQMINGSALGVDLLFQIENNFDTFNSSRYQMEIMQVTQSPLLMDRFYFLSNDSTAQKRRAAYTTFVNDVLTKIYKDFGVDTKVDAKAIVAAQVAITKVSDSPLDMRNDSRLVQLTIQQLIGKKTWKKLDWKDYFDSLGSFVNKEAFFRNLNRNITIRGLQYLMKVDDMFNSIPDMTKIIGQIATFELAIRSMDHLRVDFRSLHEKFNKDSGGTYKFFSREKICNDYVLPVFSKVISRVYSDLYFDYQAKKDADDMIEAIRNSFDRGLANLDWIDDETRRLSREKLERIVQKIGFDPELLRPMTFQKNNLPDYKNFVDSMIQVNFQKAKLPFELLTAEVDRTKKYYLNSLVVNAMYMPNLNTIEFPMAILTSPLFNKNNPSSMNFGAIGAVIGHELLHAFDDRGSKRDKEGNLKPWWPKIIRQRFNERTDCVVKQYGQYRSPYGHKLNGKLTLPENIADKAGMKYSFEAYQKAVATDRATYDGLPGLPYRGNQLFFINFAQMYCGKVTEKYWAIRTRSSVHTPYRYRVIGVLSTSEHFRQAFRCSSGSKMVAAEDCPVW